MSGKESNGDAPSRHATLSLQELAVSSENTVSLVPKVNHRLFCSGQRCPSCHSAAHDIPCCSTERESARASCKETNWGEERRLLRPCCTDADGPGAPLLCCRQTGSRGTAAASRLSFDEECVDDVCGAQEKVRVSGKANQGKRRQRIRWLPKYAQPLKSGEGTKGAKQEPGNCSKTAE